MTFELGSVIAALIGIITFAAGAFTQRSKHNNDLVAEHAVTTYILDQTQSKLETVIADVNALKTDSVEMRAKMEQFNEHIRKLDLIPRLDERMESLKELVESVQQTVSSIASARH